MVGAVVDQVRMNCGGSQSAWPAVLWKLGRSAASIARKVGAAAEPEVGPAQKVLAVSVAFVTVMALPDCDTENSAGMVRDELPVPLPLVVGVVAKGVLSSFSVALGAVLMGAGPRLPLAWTVTETGSPVFSRENEIGD